MNSRLRARKTANMPLSVCLGGVRVWDVLGARRAVPVVEQGSAVRQVRDLALGGFAPGWRTSGFCAVLRCHADAPFSQRRP